MVTEFAVKRLAQNAEKLHIRSAEYEEALALAECLRLVAVGKDRHLAGFMQMTEKPYSADLVDFAEAIKKDYGIERDTGSSAKPFNNRELLFICALYLSTNLTSDTVTLFRMLSQRSYDGVNLKVKKLVTDLSRK